jgi:hypothetical protein
MNIIHRVITLQPVRKIAFEVRDDISNQVESEGEEEIGYNRFHVSRLTTE